MTTITENISLVYAALTKERKNAAVDKSLDWLTFVIGLLPDELVVGKAGQIANKIMADKALKSRLDELQAKVEAANSRVGTLEEGMQHVQAIASTVAHNDALKAALASLLDGLKEAGEQGKSEFILDTRNWSTQHLIDSLVTADFVSFAATNNSANVIANAQVRAEKTQFTADNNSHNTIKDSSFSGSAGSVKMQGEHGQVGNVAVKGAGLQYSGPRSGTTMGCWYQGTDSAGNFVIGTITQQQAQFFDIHCTCGQSVQITRQEMLARVPRRCPRCGSTSTPPLPPSGL